MPTILSVTNSEGTRRCDGTCHKAKHPKCICVCGGRYHGAGSSDKAQEMLTRDWFGDEFTDELKAAVTPRERARLVRMAEDALSNLGRQMHEDAGQQQGLFRTGTGGA